MYGFYKQGVDKPQTLNRSAVQLEPTYQTSGFMTALGGSWVVMVPLRVPLKGSIGIQVKSSPACQKAASWRSRQKNTTLQLHVIIHSVSRCQTAVEHDITSSSELFGTQSVFERLLCSTLYKIRECITRDIEKIAHALTPTVKSRKARKSFKIRLPGVSRSAKNSCSVWRPIHRTLNPPVR